MRQSVFDQNFFDKNKFLVQKMLGSKNVAQKIWVKIFFDPKIFRTKHLLVKEIYGSKSKKKMVTKNMLGQKDIWIKGRTNFACSNVIMIVWHLLKMVHGSYLPSPKHGHQHPLISSS